MVDLSSKYLGYKLKNPIVVSSCTLSKNIEGIKKLEKAGAGAVIVKSLFEEQIEAEIIDLEKKSILKWHPEAIDYIRRIGKEISPGEYLELIKEAKNSISIPVIPSLNCITSEWWIEYAKKIENSGADAIEINIALMPANEYDSSDEIEKKYINIVHEIRQLINIPISVKIGPHFTNLLRFARNLTKAGANALVLFNRYYQLDFDINNFKTVAGNRFSTSSELHLPLRWISILSGKVDCELASSTGVHNGEDAIKLLLAGANVIQICSTLFINGLEQIEKILDYIESWMDKHNFKSINEFRGKLNQLGSENPEAYQRLQYIKALVGIE